MRLIILTVKLLKKILLYPISIIVMVAAVIVAIWEESQERKKEN